jgi:hypothetical protein
MDWPAIRLEYVHGTATLAELAERHGIYPATLTTRADKENWADERRHHQERSRAVIGQDQDVASLLARFNEDDLTVARAIRAKAAQMIQGTTTPAEIAALAKVMDIAHKIGRVALGADPESGKR